MYKTSVQEVLKTRQGTRRVYKTNVQDECTRRVYKTNVQDECTRSVKDKVQDECNKTKQMCKGIQRAKKKPETCTVEVNSVLKYHKNV